MYDALPYPPSDYHVCPCCGTEFGNDDEDFSHAQLREMWLASGARWFFGNAPPDWNWFVQLYEAGMLPLNLHGIEAEIQAEVSDVNSIALNETARFEYSLQYAKPCPVY